MTSYQQNLDLFAAAYEACGRVDHAIANAGLGEQGSIFDPNLTLESVREEPKKSVGIVDVNLKGPLYFSRIASVYLRQGGGDEASDKSLTLLSSVAGFREDPGLYVYIASKHGVLGLMRSLRGYVRWFTTFRRERERKLTFYFSSQRPDTQQTPSYSYQCHMPLDDAHAARGWHRGHLGQGGLAIQPT